MKDHLIAIFTDMYGEDHVYTAEPDDNSAEWHIENALEFFNENFDDAMNREIFAADVDWYFGRKIKVTAKTTITVADPLEDYFRKESVQEG